ncbi:MAG: extracellular solute-binding protein [Alphaproteobacteria bacterium]|nr:extracellular solute-binding protein [Alphaproteobacteria bacterium]
MKIHKTTPNMFRQCIPAILKSAIGMAFGSVLATTVLTSTACAADGLTVYSYRQPFLVEHLLDEFRAKTGIAVEVLYAKKGLIERLKLEGSGSPADVLLSSNTLRLIEAKEAGLTQPINRLAVETAIPMNLVDEDRHWIGLTRRGRILYANEETVPQGDIHDYRDLASPDNAYRVCLRSWRHPYNIGLVAYMISSVGELATEDWIRGVQNKLGRKPQGNDRAQIRAVNAGECDVAIANSYYFGVMQSDPEQVANTLKVYPIFPRFTADHGTFGFISGIALLKSADDLDAAGRLIDFFVSPGAQRAYARKNHEFPAHRMFRGMTNDEAMLDNRPLSNAMVYRRTALDLINRVIE